MFSRNLIGLCVLCLLATATSVVAQQKLTSLEADAKGNGTIKIGTQEFPLHAVVIKLNEGGGLEVTLVSDITIFCKGKWSAPEDPTKGIDLTITGTESSSTLTGGGKLFLKADGRSIASLKIDATNKLRKKLIDVTFTAE